MLGPVSDSKSPDKLSFPSQQYLNYLHSLRQLTQPGALEITTRLALELLCQFLCVPEEKDGP